MTTETPEESATSNRKPTTTATLRRMAVGERLLLKGKTIKQATTAAWRLAKHEGKRFSMSSADDGVAIWRTE